MPGWSAKNGLDPAGAGVHVVAVQPLEPPQPEPLADLVERAVGAAVGVAHRHRVVRRPQLARPARSTSPAICCGWLCSSGGSGCTSTGQPCCSTIRAAGWAIAPQAISAAVRPQGKARRSTNRSLKSARSESSTYSTSSSSVDRTRALAQGQQGHLRSLARDVARGDDAEHGQLRHQPDPDRRGRGEVGAERAGQQHLLDVAVLEPELLEQQRPAGRDRGLGELQLAHVALGEVDASRPTSVSGVGRCSTNTRSSPIFGQPVGERRARARPPARRGRSGRCGRAARP